MDRILLVLTLFVGVAIGVTIGRTTKSTKSPTDVRTIHVNYPNPEGHLERKLITLTVRGDDDPPPPVPDHIWILEVGDTRYIANTPQPYSTR